MPEPAPRPRITAAPAMRGYLEPIRAAGAVVHRGSGAAREVALVHRPHRADWTLPKGKVKRSEHILATAVREVEEEAGLRPVLGRRLAPGSYAVHGWPKRVEWWSATVGADAGFHAGAEVDAMEWLPLAAARERLSYDHEVAVLEDFMAGPQDTVPIIVLRHAAAVRKDGTGDHMRPLDPGGRADAAALSGLLGVFGPARVITSTAARCVETVAPYVARHTAALRAEPALSVAEDGEAAGGDRHAACAAFAALIAEARPAVVCTHGELIPHLMRTALAHLGAPEGQQLGLAKGDFWVLHVADGALTAMERHAAGAG